MSQQDPNYFPSVLLAMLGVSPSQAIAQGLSPFMVSRDSVNNGCKRKALSEDAENRKRFICQNPGSSSEETLSAHSGITSADIAVPRPFRQVFRMLNNAAQRRPSTDHYLYNDFFLRYHEMDPAGQLHTWTDHRLVYKYKIKLSEEMNKVTCDINRDSENTGDLERLVIDTRAGFACCASIFRKITSLSTFPISDQIRIMTNFQSIFHVWLLAMLSRNLDGPLIRLEYNNDIIDINSISSAHQKLRRVLSYMIEFIVVPLKQLHVDDYELPLLTMVLFWSTASQSLSSASPTWQMAFDIETRLMAELEEYELANNQTGRLGNLLMVIKSLQSLQFRGMRTDLAAYEKLQIIRLPEELIERFMTTAFL